MSKQENSKHWTAGTLRNRGWTEELIAELLPECSYFYAYGKRKRYWKKNAVIEAEKSQRFTEHCNAIKEQALLRENAQKEYYQNASLQAARFLENCWDKRRDKTGDILANHYHNCIVKTLLSETRPSKLPDGKAMSYIDAFCSLKPVGKPERISNTIKFFISAGHWIGRNTESKLAHKLQLCYADTLSSVCEYIIQCFAAKQPEVDVAEFLMMDNFPVRSLLNHPLSYIYSVIYVPRAIRKSLKMLVALNPKDEYPEARAMSRHFIIHTGGTNTGKTYAGFVRLAKAKSGVYLAPLRLLALEGQETLLDMGINCSLTTGEEEDRSENDTHISATAEKLDLARRFEVAVIDECQMISDRERGFAWTRAILGVLAPEVHLCCAPHAKEILIRLIDSCGDSYEIIEHKRKTPLVCMKRRMEYTDVQPGDALITFSKVGVLSIAEDLRIHGKNPAIIYGALPYSTRRKQVDGFLQGDMNYVVSTDAIGMGLNLPIRRVIFTETEKFDGIERRELKPEEIQQIAGRAGRYGMYDRGYVGATENLTMIRQALETVVPPLTHAVVGFSDLVVNVDFDILEVLQVWSAIPTVEPYVKLDVSRYIHIISKIRDSGFRLSREQELRAANIPFDETSPELMELFKNFISDFLNGEEPALPHLREPGEGRYTLPELEQYYRKLDLYFSFCKAFGCDIDTQELYEEREATAYLINNILINNLKNNISFCDHCGKPLPLHHRGRFCNSCYVQKHRFSHR